jgi:hypothetical protein
MSRISGLIEIPVMRGEAMKKKNHPEKENTRKRSKRKVEIVDIEGSDYMKRLIVYEKGKVVQELEYDSRVEKPVIEYFEKGYNLNWFIATAENEIYKEGLQMGGMIYTGKKKKKRDKE